MWLVVAFTLMALRLPAQDGASEPLRLTVAEQKELKRLWSDFLKAQDKSMREEQFAAMLLRFARGWLQAEYRYFVDGLAEVEKTGDLFDLKRRIIGGSQRFGTTKGFADAIAPSVEKQKDPAVTRVIDAGQAYHALFAAATGEDRLQRFADFAKQAEGTIYADSAKGVVDSAGEKGPWDALKAKNTTAQNFGWPTETW